MTICLPLFLAGGAGDRAFARFYPTIAIDGCDQRCAFCVNWDRRNFSVRRHLRTEDQPAGLQLSSHEAAGVGCGVDVDVSTAVRGYMTRFFS